MISSAQVPKGVFEWLNQMRRGCPLFNRVWLERTIFYMDPRQNDLAKTVGPIYPPLASRAPHARSSVTTSPLPCLTPYNPFTQHTTLTPPVSLQQRSTVREDSVVPLLLLIATTPTPCRSGYLAITAPPHISSSCVQDLDHPHYWLLPHRQSIPPPISSPSSSHPIANFFPAAGFFSDSNVPIVDFFPDASFQGMEP